MKRLPLISAVVLLMLSSVASGQTLQKGDFSADLNSEGWSLGSGIGVRTYIIFVTFEKPFDGVPTVVLALSGYDAGTGKDGIVRVSLKTEKITRDGFVIKVQTWADSRVGAVYGSWMAWAAK
jgi:hypothetical protein